MPDKGDREKRHKLIAGTYALCFQNKRKEKAMSENIYEVNEDNFEQEVKNADSLTLVDCWAPWCGPCLTVAPVLENIAETLKGKLKVCKVNIDNNHKLASELGIMSIPTMILFKSGNELDRIVGALSESELVRRIEEHLV